MPIKDLTGQIFGYLSVVRATNEREGSNVIWLCLCECGKEVKVGGYRLKSGNTKSCGCYIKKVTIKRFTTHGATLGGKTHRDYYIWSSVKKRCYNKNSKYYKDYGGRGIFLYKKWVDNFELFADYIRGLPNYVENNDLTLDRINNNKGYKPGNLKWSTRKQQASNRRSNIIVTYKNKKGTLKEIVEEFSNLSYELVRNRFVELGWPLEKALIQPSRRR